MTKLAPEWVRTSDPVIRSPARYCWTTAPALFTRLENEIRAEGTSRDSKTYNGEGTKKLKEWVKEIDKYERIINGANLCNNDPHRSGRRLSTPSPDHDPQEMMVF